MLHTDSLSTEYDGNEDYIPEQYRRTLWISWGIGKSAGYQPMLHFKPSFKFVIEAWFPAFGQHPTLKCCSQRRMERSVLKEWRVMCLGLNS